MGMDVEKTRVMRISRQPSPIQIMTDQKHPENVDYFKYFGSIITKIRVKPDPGLTWQKKSFNTRKALVTIKLDLNLRKKLIKCHNWSIALYSLGNSGQQIENTGKVLKCGAEEG
jgi:hypothetical protein